MEVARFNDLRARWRSLRRERRRRRLIARYIFVRNVFV
jgi:hypothetical protein